MTGLARGEPGAGVVVGQAAAVGKTVLVFPGQGAQWTGMGRQLLDESPVFAERMRRCDEALAEFVSWSLLDVVAGVAGRRGWIESMWCSRCRGRSWCHWPSCGVRWGWHRMR
ncbi:acyl transferase domain protein [Mycobacterium ulcerans str. Harvey]|uniref:Acyl transferase domain protein n=1 Tax=Mycobacterium ulcerans str. Harvey TaxID=1299332 RepID=A0ABN0QYT8_MYCUL|nr:acyl transferase domain protein [Mycobacterium ulcerans str. Harvey]